MSLSESGVEQLLTGLGSPDKALREQSEAAFNSLVQQRASPPVVLVFLQFIGNAGRDRYLRQLAVVLLRKVLVIPWNSTYGIDDPNSVMQNSYYYQLDNDMQKAVQGSLLLVLRNETDTLLKTSLSELMGEFCINTIEPTQWPELLQFISSSIASSNPLDREVGLYLFGKIAYDSNQLQQLLSSPISLQSMILMFQTSLNDDANEGRVLLAAIKALVNIIMNLSQVSDTDHFQCLVGNIINGLHLALDRCAKQAFPDTVPIAFIDSLIELAEQNEKKFYAPQLKEIYTSLLDLVENQSIPSAIRHILIELVVTISEEYPSQARKIKSPSGEKGYIALRLLPLLVTMMTSIKDDPQWDSKNTLDTNDEGTVNDADVSEAALARITQALGLKSTYAVMAGCISKCLTSSSWKEQIAGLKITGNYLELTAQIDNKAQLNKHRQEMATTLATFITSSNNRVRASAFYALGQYFSYHGRGLNDEIVEQLLSLCLQHLNNNVIILPPLLKYEVLVCLTSAIDIVKTCVVEKHIGTILSLIVNSLISGPLLVQEICVTSIISLAESVKGEQIACYYDSLMPVLKQLLTYASDNRLDQLWGQGLECYALVGESSGKSKFYPDALALMQSLVGVHQQRELAVAQGHEVVDETKYLLKAWVRIARCLGAEFSPFLQGVMEKILVAINQDVTAECDLEDIEERSDIDVLENQDGTYMCVRTSAVEEQASACQLLYLLVERLQEHIFPYAEQTIRSIAPLLSSPHEDVRSYCVSLIPELVRVTAKATCRDSSSTTLVSVSSFLLGQLIQYLEKESVVDLILTGLECLKLTLTYSATQWIYYPTNDEPPQLNPTTSLRILSREQISGISEAMKIVLRDAIQRRAVSRAENQQIHDVEGLDEDDIMAQGMLGGENMELFYSISNTIEVLFNIFGKDFYATYLEQWHTMVSEMARPYCMKEDRVFAYCVLSDVIKNGLDDSTKSYLTEMLPLLIQGLDGDDSSPRLTASYALGLAVQRYPAEFVPFAHSALSGLGASIAMKEDEENVRGECTDNSVAAVGYIIDNVSKYNVQLNYDFLWNEWLNYLPLQHDVNEGHNVLEQLLGHINQNCPHLHLNEIDGLARVVNILLTAYDTEMSTTEIDKKINGVLASISTAAWSTSNNITSENIQKYQLIASGGYTSNRTSSIREL